MKFLTSKINTYSKLIKRFVQYSSVGVGTFGFDLLIVYLLKNTTSLPDSLIIGLGFFIAVSVNFIISYHWIFKGTSRPETTGYLYFISIAALGLLAIIPGTLFLQNTLGINLYLSRICIAGVVGTMNFLLNNFFNFKMPN